jgi:hypothetical protein
MRTGRQIKFSGRTGLIQLIGNADLPALNKQTAPPPHPIRGSRGCAAPSGASQRGDPTVGWTTTQILASILFFAGRFR